MNQEQEVFFKILEQKMDELYGIMKHAPRIFPEQIHDCINYGGKIVNASLNWSFQSHDDTDPVKIVIEEVRIGHLSVVRHDSDWDNWDHSKLKEDEDDED